MEWYLWVLSIYGAMAFLTFLILFIVLFVSGELKDFKKKYVWITTFFQPVGFVAMYYATIRYWIIRPIGIKIYMSRNKKA